MSNDQTTQTFKKTPPVFSFQRLMMLTDGAFFNQIAGHYESNPLQVIRHGIRGTQNTDAPDKEVSNIQQTESAKTDVAAEALVVQFGLRMVDLEHGLFACAAETPELSRAVRDSVVGFVERAKTSKGLEEVTRRIARNIASGGWLWRNRSVASSVAVKVEHGGRELASFDALSISTDRFDNYSAAEEKVAQVLAAGLRGDVSANLSVTAILRFGVQGPVEVFPSQAYIENKPTGFARPLYKISAAAKHDRTDSVRVMGQAALRDQKIANRLRSIDTWYPGYADIGKPIPVEPNGACLEFNFAFRTVKTHSAFDLFARLNTIDPDTDEGMFCIGVLIRGGVLSKSGKTPTRGETDQEVDEAAEAAGE